MCLVSLSRACRGGLIGARDIIHILPRRRRISPSPVVRQPVGQLAHRRGRQVGQQLRQVMLRVDVVSAASAGQAGRDRSSLVDTMSTVARDLNNGNGVTRVASLPRGQIAPTSPTWRRTLTRASACDASQPPRIEPATSLFQRSGPEPVLAAAIVALNGLIHDTLRSQRHGAGAEPIGDVSAGL